MCCGFCSCGGGVRLDCGRSLRFLGGGGRTGTIAPERKYWTWKNLWKEWLMAPRTRTNSSRTSNKLLFSEQASEVLLPAVAGSTVRADLPCDLEKRRDPYARFYAALGSLREEFHRIGRFDDANAKLDELCKLLVLKVLDARHPVAGHLSRLHYEYLRVVAKQRHGDEKRIAFAIHDVYRHLADQFPDEMMAFGSRNGLNMSPDDDEFACALLPLFDALPKADVCENQRWSFDGVNEAFGHFIQDSFRNRKEDAQYMTPPEVVSSIVDIAIQDILVDLAGSTPQVPILVADPTCGVGSFLAAMYRHALHSPLGAGTLADRLQLFGQDKVDRMVRLACVNLQIFAGIDAIIRQGNSILPPSSLADVQGKIDLILTNPPFGATFDSQELLKHLTEEQLPTLHALARRQALPRTLDSEYILLDRALALLKPGGRLLMVVPDHVVSTGGFSEAFRLTLQRVGDLVAVFDLPTETFAQAGTRTKTSVVYLRRRNSADRTQPRHVFMATSEDLGFRVVSRTGATVKRIVGPNDMEIIAETYKQFRQSARRKQTSFASAANRQLPRSQQIAFSTTDGRPASTRPNDCRHSNAWSKLVKLILSHSNSLIWSPLTLTVKNVYSPTSKTVASAFFM